MYQERKFRLFYVPEIELGCYTIRYDITSSSVKFRALQIDIYIYIYISKYEVGLFGDYFPLKVRYFRMSIETIAHHSSAVHIKNEL